MRWYLAVCTVCTPVAPIPFSGGPDERDAWADAHEEATGHSVLRVEEER